MPRAFFIDTSRCTACRGCQVACKEWHGLPAVATKQRGSHQNPPDLNPFNFKLVRFTEEKIDGKVQWHFFPEQCRHCLDPSCKGAADSFAPGAIVVDDKTKAVLFTEKTKGFTAEQFNEVKDACPYNVPRRNEQSGLLAKCDMCVERLQAKMSPVCVKTCCTGAMNFGERADMLSMARNRLLDVKRSYPNAMLVDPDEVTVIYLITNPKKSSVKKAERPAENFSRRDLLTNLVSPFKRIAG